MEFALSLELILPVLSPPELGLMPQFFSCAVLHVSDFEPRVRAQGRCEAKMNGAHWPVPHGASASHVDYG